MIGAIQNAIIRLAGGMPPSVSKRNTRYGEVASGWGASGGIPDLDYLDEMAFPDFLDKYRRMANDAQIYKVLRESILPLVNADWMIEPASEDRRDILIGEFVAANLYQQEGDTYGAQFWSAVHWEDRLEDILRFLQQGFTVFQKVYRKEGQYTIFDKVKYLMPESIQRFEPDPKVLDSFSGITRNYVDTAGEPHPNEFVEMDRLMFYTWDQEGSNILGKALLRSMLMAWEFKQRYAKLQMIDKQKTAIGIPFFSNNPDDSPEDQNRGEQLAKSIRAGRLEKLYAKIKTGQDFGWKEGGQSTKGIPELVDQMNTEIRNVGGMGFTELGQGGQGGSRGVAGTQAAFSSILLNAIAKKVVRRELVLIREAVDLNFPGVQRYPRLKVRGIDPFEKTRIQGEIVAAISAKAITNTIDTENELRRGWGLMEIGEDERRAAQVSEPSSTDGSGPDPKAGNDGSGGGGGGASSDATGADATASGGEGTAQPATQARGRGAGVRLAAVPDGSGSGGSVEEDGPVVRARVDADAIRAGLERWEATYLSSLALVQRDMREAAVEQIRQGKIRPRTPDEVKVPFQDDLKDRLVAILKSVRDFGRDQVMAEVNRQLQTLKKGAVPDPTTRRGAIAYSNQQAEVVAQLDVSNLVQRLQTQVVQRYNDLAGTGASAAEIATSINDYLGSLTGAQIEGMARASTSQVFNSGRNVSILELAPQLQPDAIRVEVLDTNTCEPCRALDGQRFPIGSAEYLENQPPRQCDGGVRCRGFYVVEAMP